MAINPKIRDKAEKIRKEVYGKDVREALASGLEVMSEDVEDIKDRQVNVESQFQNVESQFQAVLDETTGKDVISAPEVTAARVGADGTQYPNLKQRLDSEHDKITAQLVQNAQEKIYNGVGGSRINKPVLTLIDDDGRKEVWTILKPFAERKKIPITCALITNRIGGSNYLTLEQIKALSDTGYFEFVSQTHNHVNGNEVSDSVLDEEYRLSREWLLKHGYNADVLVYPFGAVSDRIKDIASRYYKLGIMVDRGDIRHNRPPLDSYDIKRVYIDYGVQRAKDYIDDIVENGGWMVLGMHSHYPDFNIDDVEEVVDYAISKGVAIKNCREAIQHYGNILEVGKGSEILKTGATIDSEGEVHGSVLGRYRRKEMSAEDATLGVTNYPFNAVTVGYLTNPDAVNMPTGRAGVLEVHRFVNDTFSYRIWRPLFTTEVYRSRWDNENKVWLPFELLNKTETNYRIKTMSAEDATLDISNYPVNTVTVGYLTNPDAVNMPTGRAGVLEVHRFINDTFSYRIWRPLFTTEVYRSRWDNDNKVWLPFELLNKTETSQRKNVVISHGLVPATSSKDSTVISDIFEVNRVVIATPLTELPDGITWNSWITQNGQAKIRLTNVKGESVHVGDVEWNLKTLIN